MLTNEAHQERLTMRGVSERMLGVKRFVNAGIRIRVVSTKPHPGKDTVTFDNRVMWVVREHRRGGVIDTEATPPCISHAPQPNEWLTWLVSEQQEQALLHDDPAVPAQLVYGSEGAGKTKLLVMWQAIQWLKRIGEYRTGGQTAPTLGRLGTVRNEIAGTWRPEWARFVDRDDFKGYEMCDGTRIQFQYTYQQSEARGAPIQGFNWDWVGRDEMQDQVGAHEDIESRGRSAPGGIYWQLCTATAKDSTPWRNLRDILLGSGVWLKRSLSIYRSPFVAPRRLEDAKKTMDAREFLRRYGDPITGEVADLPPELAVYYGWLRTRNLVARPQIARDVTAAVLRGYRSYLHPGREFGLLLGHDPGVIYNTTEVLRLLMFGDVPTWVVVGELQTKQTTEKEHAAALAKYLRETFYVNHPLIGGPLAMAFVDPHGKGDAQSDYQTHYMAFQKEGIDAFNPAPQTVRIKRTARVEMVNRLLGGSADNIGTPRLVIATDDQKRPVAPVLVDSFENLKKAEGDDNPEGGRRKDETDKTHAPAALAYALWMFEQEAFTEQTIKTARAAGVA